MVIKNKLEYLKLDQHEEENNNPENNSNTKKKFIKLFLLVIVIFIIYIFISSKKSRKKHSFRLSSFIDNDMYKYIETSNNIKLLIIKIPKGFYSYFTINIKLGFINDPFNYEGIIDFWRHLWIYGSSNLTKDSFNFVNKNYETDYFSSTKNNNLYITTKFKSEYYLNIINFLKNKINNPNIKKVDFLKEFNAIINNNNLKYIETKNKDLKILLKKLSNKDSFLFKDGTNEYDTDENTVDALMNAINNINSKYISSNLMSAILFTTENVDYDKIKSSLEKIKNYNINLGEFTNELNSNNFPNFMYGNFIILKSYDYEIPRLSLIIDLNMNNYKNNNKSNLKFFNFLLKLDGPKSLKRFLKIDEELIYDVFINELVKFNNETVINIQFYLTETGLLSMKKVISYFNLFIEYWKKTDFKELINDLEIISKYQFYFNSRFGEKIIKNDLDLNIKLTEKLQFFNYEQIFSNEKLFGITDIDEFKEFLNNFDIKKLIYIFQSNKFENYKNTDKKRNFSNNLSFIESNGIIKNDNFYNKNIFDIDFKNMPLDNKLTQDSYYQIFEIPKVTLDSILKTTKLKEFKLIKNIKNIPKSFEILNENCNNFEISKFNYSVDENYLTINNFFSYSNEIINEYLQWLNQQEDFNSLKECLIDEVKLDDRNLNPAIIYEDKQFSFYNKIYRSNLNFLSTIIVEINNKYIHDKILSKKILMNSISNNLFCNYVNYIINEKFEEYIISGYDFQCNPHGFKIILKFTGYKDKLFKFLKDVLNSIKSDSLNERIFELLKNKLFSELLDINNHTKNYDYAESIFEQIISLYSLKFIEKSNYKIFESIFKSINWVEFKKLFLNIFDENYLLVLYMGNYSDNEALLHLDFYKSLIKNFTEFSRFDPLYNNKYFEINSHDMIRLKSNNKFDKNSIYITFIILEKFGYKNKFIFSMINNIISNNIKKILLNNNFSIQEANSKLIEKNYQYGIFIKIIGTGFEPNDIEEHVENALFDSYDYIKRLKKKDFEILKSEMHEKIIEENYTYENIIMESYKNIYRSKIILVNDDLDNAKKTLILEDLMHLFRKYLIEMQRRVSIEVYIKKISNKVLNKNKMINKNSYRLKQPSNYLSSN